MPTTVLKSDILMKRTDSPKYLTTGYLVPSSTSFFDESLFISAEQIVSRGFYWEPLRINSSDISIPTMLLRPGIKQSLMNSRISRKAFSIGRHLT